MLTPNSLLFNVSGDPQDVVIPLPFGRYNDVTVIRWIYVNQATFADTLKVSFTITRASSQVTYVIYDNTVTSQVLSFETFIVVTPEDKISVTVTQGISQTTLYLMINYEQYTIDRVENGG